MATQEVCKRRIRACVQQVKVRYGDCVDVSVGVRELVRELTVKAQSVLDDQDKMVADATAASDSKNN